MGRNGWDGPNKSSLDPHIFGLWPLVTPLPRDVVLQGLLQLLLQHLVPALQLVHFGQEAAEAQVQGLQHADVGSQVVTQRRGRGGRAAQGAAQVQVSRSRRRKGSQIQPEPVRPEPAVVTQEVARLRDNGVTLTRHVVMLRMRSQEAALPENRIHARVGESEMLKVRHELRLTQVPLQVI